MRWSVNAVLVLILFLVLQHKKKTLSPFSWDEWVPESRVLKYVDSNLAKQKELQKANQ